jgi:uncharacterized Zn finger protein (UPF0148 family)
VGKNPCPVCATPDAAYVNGRVLCGGCGLDTPAVLVVAYLKQPKKTISFERATTMYERLRRPMVPFGYWLMKRRLELVGKP